MILGFSVSLLIGNLFQQLYNMADSAIVDHMIGMNALAALSSISAVFFLVIGSVIGLTAGSSTITGPCGCICSITAQTGLSQRLPGNTGGRIAADIPLLRQYYFKMKKDAPIHKKIKALKKQ